MFRALDDLASSVAAVKAREHLGVLVSAVDEIGVSLPRWAIVHARDIVIAKTVHMIFAKPVLVELKEIVARELLRVVSSGPALEKLAGEDPHHRIRFPRCIV